MEIDIELNGQGESAHEQAQQEWDNDHPVERAMFAGHEMSLSKVAPVGQDLFELNYLGFYARGFESVAEAKANAAGFAREVLSIMGQMIKD